LSKVKGTHAVYVSQPQAVASLIEKAARAWQQQRNKSQDYSTIVSPCRAGFGAILAPQIVPGKFPDSRLA
jgi:hypothetical protein